VFPILGGLYTYAIWYIPFIYINFIITAVFAIAVGFLMNQVVIKLGKVRSPKLAILLCLLGGFAALYAHWVVWADLIVNASNTIGTSRIGITVSSTNLEQLLILAKNPKVLFELMSEVNKYGSWGLFGQTVSGLLLWIIWVIEAMVILLGSVLVGMHQAKNPFCEKSNKWFKEIALPPTSYIFSKPDLVRELEQGSDKILSTLNLHDVVFDNMSYSQFTVFSSDHDEHYLTAVNMKKIVDNKGEVNYEEDDVIEHIEITTKILNLLQNVKKKERDTKNESAE
jgi:hypothetical protein